jgi:hypothetical protein
MERWTIGTNSIHKTAMIYKEVGPWWVFFIEWLSISLCDLLHKLPPIPLPNCEICRDCFTGSDLLEPGEMTTIREWYGDFQSMWCIKVDSPIIQWCYHKYVRIKIPIEYNWVLSHMPDTLSQT